ncbi:hypothetical protein LP414_06510 [Polaromonas sp. P1(28)-13]|nr:hypothetical protein LP414_06510 [Polaromonas sp. P1(28)-13]
MNIKLAISTAACAFIAIAPVTAAAQAGPTQAAGSAVAAGQAAPNPLIGFGSGTGMGPGGGAGSASSLAGGFGSPLSGSGSGSQTFGGGFTQQQAPGSGPLSARPATSAGGGSALVRP